MIFCNFFIFKTLHLKNFGNLNFFFFIFLINSFAFFSFISINITSAPCSQKCSTIEEPIPSAPPLIKTFLLIKSKYLTFILYHFFKFIICKQSIFFVW